MTRDDFRIISDLASRRTGIDLGEHKAQMVYTRLSRRLRHLGLTSFSDYVRLLERDEDGGETAVLVNALTTNLTKFFRSETHFDHLRDVVIPDCRERIRRGQSRRIRIWSTACSTGEEPYSIAISILRALGENIAGTNVRVLATDIDTDMLERASAGVYGENAIEAVGPEDRRRFFEVECSKGERRWRVKDSVRKLITFKKLNLLGPWPMRGEFDAVLCRNVMIYFDRPTKDQLIERLAGILRPGAWLYLGSSETMMSPGPGLSREGDTIYRRRET